MARIWGKEYKVFFKLGEKKPYKETYKKTLSKWSYYNKL